MRHSDATFLRREVLPFLFRLTGVIPDAQSVADAVAERLHDEDPPDTALHAERFTNRWHQVFTETGDPAGWHVTLQVDGQEVPYITGFEHEGEHAGRVSLTLDGRFGMDTTVEELGRWAWFMANAMAVSAGRTSHGPNSYVRNPHGRSGAGDPPEIIGTPICTKPGDCSHCDPACEIDHPHTGACMRVLLRPDV